MEDSLAIFQRLTDSGKHALVIARRNKFDTSGQVGYVRNCDDTAKLKEGDEFTMPGGWHIEQREDADGNVLTTKDGEPLSFFAWS